MFSRLLTGHETESEHSSPNNLAASPHKDSCKNQFYKHIWLAPFRKKRKNLLAAFQRQTGLSARNTGEALFLSSTIHAQKMAGLSGEAGIIIRQSTAIADEAKQRLQRALATLER